MRPARLRWLSGIAVALMLVTAGSVARAQDPADDPFCTLFTPTEVGDILGTEVTAEPDAALGGCRWAAFASGGTATAAAQWTESSLADHKAAWPDGSDVTIGGRPAYYSPGIFLNELLIELDAGVLYLLVTGFDGDVEAALSELGELAVSRSDSLPPPAQPEVVPPNEADLPHADAALEALFPATIGGEDLVVTSQAGQEAIPESDDREPVLEVLGTIGKSVDDLTVGYALSEAGSIIAVRVAGADVSAVQLPLLEALSGASVVMSPAQVAGKDVTVLVSDPPTYAYPSGEVLWVILAEEPALTEILTALP